MHIGEIMTADCANGIGMRVTVFVSGCRNHCPGCFQPETWDFDYGKLYTPEMEDEIIKELSHPYYDGLTLLGGDPMRRVTRRAFFRSCSEFIKNFRRRTSGPIPAIFMTRTLYLVAESTWME